MNRIFAVPDIHGRADLLEVLINKLTDEEKMDLAVDKLIFLGDMIDRGSNSKAVIEVIQKIQSLAPKDNVIVLTGNHEWLAIDAILSDEPDAFQLWMWNGGSATLNSFEGTIPPQIVQWMKELPLYHEEEGFFFSHAPIPSEEHRHSGNKGLSYRKEELTWTYFEKEGFFERKDEKAIGVCGHVHALNRGLKEPRFYDHYIYADAGCGCSESAPLVAIEVKSRKVIYATVGEADKRSMGKL